MNQDLINSINKITDGLSFQYPDCFVNEEVPKINNQWDCHNPIEKFMTSNKRLINTIQDCEVTCEQMTDMIMYKQDNNMRMNQLELLRDCSDACGMMVKYLARDSVFAKEHASFCATVCELCGKECSKFQDVESQRCAEICLNCARECKNFAM